MSIQWAYDTFEGAMSLGRQSTSVAIELIPRRMGPIAHVDYTVLRHHALVQTRGGWSW